VRIRIVSTVSGRSAPETVLTIHTGTQGTIITCTSPAASGVCPTCGSSTTPPRRPPFVSCAASSSGWSLPRSVRPHTATPVGRCRQRRRSPSSVSSPSPDHSPSASCAHCPDSCSSPSPPNRSSTSSSTASAGPATAPMPWHPHLGRWSAGAGVDGRACSSGRRSAVVVVGVAFVLPPRTLVRRGRIGVRDRPRHRPAGLPAPIADERLRRSHRIEGHRPRQPLRARLGAASLRRRPCPSPAAAFVLVAGAELIVVALVFGLAAGLAQTPPPT